MLCYGDGATILLCRLTALAAGGTTKFVVTCEIVKTPENKKIISLKFF